MKVKLVKEKLLSGFFMLGLLGVGMILVVASEFQKPYPYYTSLGSPFAILLLLSVFAFLVWCWMSGDDE